MKKIIEWFSQSNRWKHLVGGAAVALAGDSAYGSLLACLVAAGCLEYKDKAWGGAWDWIDFALTLAGGAAVVLFKIAWLP